MMPGPSVTGQVGPGVPVVRAFDQTLGTTTPVIDSLLQPRLRSRG